MDGCDECAAKDAEIAKLKRRHTEWKMRVRDRAIAEADRRGWCGEFDDIIRSLGMQGRYATYAVTFTFPSYGRVVTDTLRCLARTPEHATELVRKQTSRMYNSVEITDVVVCDVVGAG